MSGPKPNDAANQELCPKEEICPLNTVPAGSLVRVKQLNGSHEVTLKLRELGFCEEQRVKLLLKHTNTAVICQVCNARIGLSGRLAEWIMVQPIPHANQGAA